MSDLQVALHKIIHELLHGNNGLIRLRIVHGDSDSIRRDAQWMRSHVQPTQLLSLIQELLYESLILTFASADGEDHLHA